VQGISKKVAKPGKDPVRVIDIPMHQRRNGIERIEQEVRVELHLQRLQLSLRELRSQLSGTHFTFPEFLVVFAPIPDAKNGPIREEVDVKIHNERALDCFKGFIQLKSIGAERLNNDLGNQKLNG